MLTGIIEEYTIAATVHHTLRSHHGDGTRTVELHARGPEEAHRECISEGRLEPAARGPHQSEPLL
jgi:hypothetical protein